MPYNYKGDLYKIEIVAKLQSKGYSVKSVNALNKIMEKKNIKKITLLSILSLLSLFFISIFFDFV